MIGPTFFKRYFHAFFALPKGQRLPTLKRFLKSKTSGKNFSLVTLIWLLVRAIGITLGKERATRFFLAFQSMKNSNAHILAWLRRLESLDDKIVEQFSKSIFLTTQNAQAMVTVSFHYLTRPFMCAYLLNTDLETMKQDFSPILVSNDRKATALGIAKWHLKHNTDAFKRVQKIVQLPFDTRSTSIYNSFGVNIANSISNPTNANLCIPQSNKKTLVISHGLHTNESLPMITYGRSDVTLIDVADLFGKVDLKSFITQYKIGKIGIEHARSRISRFSKQYHNLHLRTAALAQELVQELCGLANPQSKQIKNAKDAATVAVADKLFFEALKIEAIECLLEDEEFEEIFIIFSPTSRNSSLWKSLSSITRLKTDDRIILLSDPSEFSTRGKLNAVLNSLTTTPVRQKEYFDINIFTENVTKAFKNVAENSTKFLYENSLERKHSKSIFFVTSNNSAYNFSTAHFSNLLKNSYDLRLFTGSLNTTNILAQFSVNDLPKIDSFATPPKSRVYTIYQAMLSSQIDMEVNRIFSEKNLDLFYIVGSSAISHEICKTIWTDLVIQNLLTLQAENNSIPDAILVSPAREATSLAVISAARNHQIPTVIFEPHGLDANYCRYLKISSDFYGVSSSYFHDVGENGYAIPIERTRVIGSPRIQRPKDYDRSQNYYNARSKLSISLDTRAVSFFSQPSYWLGVAEVWENLLKAAQKANFKVLLRTHPEESKDRVSRYMELAKKMGLSEQFEYIEGELGDLIAASDVATTVYSAAAIDAAILSCPVVCIGVENEELPIQQHQIVHAPFAVGAEDIAQKIGYYLNKADKNFEINERLLQAEPWFFEGPDRYILDFLEDVIKMPKEEQLRQAVGEGKNGIFLDPPFREFKI